MNQEFTLCMQFEGSFDDSRFSSTFGSVREHCKCAAMNKSTGRAGWLPPKVRLGKARPLDLRVACGNFVDLRITILVFLNRLSIYNKR